MTNSGVPLTADEIKTITEFVDIEAPPPDGQPTAHMIFGTNQFEPVLDLVVERYRRGLAPLIIATGGINRHNGVVEGREFHQRLIEQGVPEAAIRYEDQSADTRQNVENAIPFIREALAAGLAITAISKWFHRRTIHALKTLVPDIGAFYGLPWEPIYAGRPVTRTDWPDIPDGKRRVVRERVEVTRRVNDGSFAAVQLVDGAWR